LPKFSHVTPLFCDLHWLPVLFASDSRCSLVAYWPTRLSGYKAVRGTAPTYLQASSKSYPILQLECSVQLLELAGWYHLH